MAGFRARDRLASRGASPLASSGPCRVTIAPHDGLLRSFGRFGKPVGFGPTEIHGKHGPWQGTWRVHTPCVRVVWRSPSLSWERWGERIYRGVLLPALLVPLCVLLLCTRGTCSSTSGRCLQEIC